MSPMRGAMRSPHAIERIAKSHLHGGPTKRTRENRACRVTKRADPRVYRHRESTEWSINGK
jgi:hypothetical protein